MRTASPTAENVTKKAVNPRSVRRAFRMVRDRISASLDSTSASIAVARDEPRAQFASLGTRLQQVLRPRHTALETMFGGVATVALLDLERRGIGHLAQVERSVTVGSCGREGQGELLDVAGDPGADDQLGRRWRQ